MTRLGTAFLRLSFLIVLTLFLFLLGGRPSSVHAATFTVTRTDDPTPGPCWASDCSLREAIRAANTVPGYDIIDLPAGTYTLTIPQDGTPNDGADGDLDVTDSVTIRGAGAAATIIDGGDIDRVLEVDPEQVGVIAQIYNLTVRDGNVSGGGGGIQVWGSIELANVTVSGNSAASGGGIWNRGTATLTNVTVSGNSATWGGGIMNVDDTATIFLTNVTVSGNSAGEYGGGIWNFGVATLTNVTVSGNTAGISGGGVTNHDTGTLKNTIVANNPGGDCAGTVAITSDGYNLDSDGTCGLSGPYDGTANPLLGPLAWNGGPTKTRRLYPGSPAIDAGSNGFCPATDQRGVARPADGNLNGVATCDRGAYELERKTDITQYRPSDHRWYVRSFGSVQWGEAGDIPVPAEYYGTGKAVIAQYRPSNGKWYLKDGVTVRWGEPGDIPVPADYNGGAADIAMYRPSNGTWYIRFVGNFRWGQPSDIPVPADYDGDGEAEIAMYRPSNGTWYIRGGATVSWGVAGDIPVPADYDGDGDADIAMYRPSNGTWYIRGGATVSWGVAGDVPVPADYDGDGNTDIAQYRPSSGMWYMRGIGNVHWGRTGDVPVPEDYY
jgi:CSLREA domain-containing protein